MQHEVAALGEHERDRRRHEPVLPDVEVAVRGRGVERPPVHEKLAGGGPNIQILKSNDPKCLIYGSYGTSSSSPGYIVVVNSNPSLDAAELFLALGPPAAPAFGLSQVGVVALIFLLGAIGCHSAGATGRRKSGIDTLY